MSPVAGAAVPADFVECAREYFARAAASAGLIVRAFELGPSVVVMRFAGPALAEMMTRALAHREVPVPAAADLTVCFFDSQSTGVAMPPPPWSWDEYRGTGEIDGFNEGGVHVMYVSGAGVLQCLDSSRNLAVYWTPDRNRVPYWEQSFPLRPILNWWLRARPLQPVHAGAVGYADGGVLITGKSGSGKSTTTLACLDSELLYAGDDYVLAATEPAPYVFSLYNTAKLEFDNVRRFSTYEKLVSNPGRDGDEKALLFLNEHLPEKMAAGFPIRAILMPRFTGGLDTQLHPAPASAAFMAIAPTTSRHLTGTIRETTAKVLRLSRSVPVFVIETGTDLAQIPATIAKLLRTLR